MYICIFVYFNSGKNTKHGEKNGMECNSYKARLSRSNRILNKWLELKQCLRCIKSKLNTFKGLNAYNNACSINVYGTFRMKKKRKNETQIVVNREHSHMKL